MLYEIIFVNAVSGLSAKKLTNDELQSITAQLAVNIVDYLDSDL